MKPIFNCELEYFPSRHLNQIYDGFGKLKKKGIVSLSIKQKSNSSSIPLLSVLINNKYRVIYDALDGLNWIEGSESENLHYFKKNIFTDYYFKRSYSKQLINHKPDHCKVYPLGLYYTYEPDSRFQGGIKAILKNTLVQSNFFKNKYFTSLDFENYPIPNKESKILFFTRLWNPEDVKLENLKVEREIMNNNRINCIKACKKEFGNQFIGGIQNDSFSSKYARNLIVPSSITKRRNFINFIKKSNICIATSGLHGSMGGKMGEYVAASRAIISEPLEYNLPGNFKNGRNYLSFHDENSLIHSVNELLLNKSLMNDLMFNNFHYYNNYTKSDVMILNSLLQIIQDEDFKSSKLEG